MGGRRTRRGPDHLPGRADFIRVDERVTQRGIKGHARLGRAS